MATQPARPLAEAAAHRTLDAEQRVRAALHELDREGATINFAAVAQRARVSREFLYEHADFRAEIAVAARRAGRRTGTPADPPPRQRCLAARSPARRA